MADAEHDRQDPGKNGTADDLRLCAVLEESRALGLLGPGPVEPHIDHARAYLGALDGALEVLDLGSGGGLPGLVLARARADLTLVLVDAMERRCRFLERAVDELSLGRRVSVECGRAEELAWRADLRHRFSCVVTRSFGPPAVTAECAVGFLAVRGRLLVSEPPEQLDDRWPSEGLQILGLEVGDLVQGAAGAVQVLQLTGTSDDRFPRRVGIPAKRPLF